MEERQKIKAFSDLRMLRRQHREKFIIHRQTIWVLRKEWNPTAPHRINDCLDDLIRIMSEFRSDLKKENAPLNPILFSGLLYYQLLTVAPYDRNNILYASYTVAKYLQELIVLPEISYPLTKLIYDNKNECNDRMAEVRQACNINQWLLFYLDILDKTFGTEYSFIKEKHRCLDRSRDVLNKAKNIPNHMKERMKREMIMMYQKPVFRIEELMNDCDITHSTATKMVNLFIELKLVKQANDKQRYRKYSDLLGTLKKEVQKVKELQPEKYYICCALNLTAKNKRELYDMFSDYMESANDIMSLIDIDDFLECPENMDIVRKHYKLWLESTEILGEVFNQNVFIDCESLLYNIEEESRRFVETSCYYECLDILEKEKILLLLGMPGTGKTVTTKMLAIYYASKGYRIRYTTNGDISDIKNAISTQKDLPEIILLDDCLGQHYFRMKETQGNELLSLVKYVTCHKNKKLIMNSRVAIFQQAKEQVIEFRQFAEDEKFEIKILDMGKLSLSDKGRIFHNHIYFKGLPADYYQDILKDFHYREIVKHNNYTPRIMEFVTREYNFKKVSSGHYYEYVLRCLDNPTEIWQDEFSEKLQQEDRVFLTTLYSLTDTSIDENVVKRAFNYRLSNNTIADTSRNIWEDVLKRLEGAFIQIIEKNGKKEIGAINPSVNDFLRECLQKNDIEREYIRKNATEYEQIKRGFSENMEDIIRAGQANLYHYANQNEEMYVILTYVCRLDVFHDNYKYVVERFFQTLPYGFFEGMMGRCEILIRLLLDKFDTFYHTYDCLDDSYRKLFGAISA